ncbi:hypothetical protein ERD95_15290 [Enterobacteriaceae bacterium ML5]|nr:hypothetical protein ERD95_15290 [Enterobacteriaceae bacterium ML5]
MAKTTTENVPASCGYQGYEFHGGYPDSICGDGYLWDADSGFDGCLDSGGEIPCPSCNRAAWLAYYRPEIIEIGEEQGYERHHHPRTVKYGGFPELIRLDIDAMRKARRWIKRGWYRGRKQKQQEEIEYAR